MNPVNPMTTRRHRDNKSRQTYRPPKSSTQHSCPSLEAVGPNAISQDLSTAPAAPARLDRARAQQLPLSRYRLRLPRRLVLHSPLQLPSAPRPRRCASDPPRRRRPAQARIRSYRCPDQYLDQASPTRRLKLDTFSPSVLTQAGLVGSGCCDAEAIGSKLTHRVCVSNAVNIFLSCCFCRRRRCFRHVLFTVVAPNPLRFRCGVLRKNGGSRLRQNG
jgi:hypothetical protein